MDLILIELICWVGLLFFFWALKDALGRVENDIESFSVFNNHAQQAMLAQQRIQHYRPQTVSEPIGSYRGEPIYRYVVIDGRSYEFDRVCPSENMAMLGEQERCVVPGLVYTECRNKTPT